MRSCSVAEELNMDSLSQWSIDSSLRGDRLCLQFAPGCETNALARIKLGCRVACVRVRVFVRWLKAPFGAGVNDTRGAAIDRRVVYGGGMHNDRLLSPLFILLVVKGGLCC